MKQKKTVSAKPQTENHIIIAQVFCFLYLFVGFIPLFGALDYDAPEWLYISLLNLASLIYVYKNKALFASFVLAKRAKLYLGLFSGFFVIGCLSAVTAINTSESLVHLARLINIIVALYCLYIFIRQAPRKFFELVCKIAIVIVAYFGFKAVRYFLGNSSASRTHEFLMGFPHNFSNINIYTAFIAVQFPLVVYGFLYFKNAWKYVSGVVVLIAILALIFAGSRTALLSLLVMLFILIGFLIFGIVKHKVSLKVETLTLIVLPIASLFLVLYTNKIDKTSMNSFDELLQTREADYYNGRKSLERNIANAKKITPTDVTIKVASRTNSGRYSLWNMAFENFKENPFLGVGYGNFKAVAKKNHYANYTNRKGTFANPRRAHSDFLEKLAETGIVGFLVYVSLFLVPFWWFVTALRREKDFFKQSILVIVFSVAVAYTIDALLNFPLERAPVQLYFIVAVVFMMIFSQEPSAAAKKAKNEKRVALIFGLVFFVSLASVASNYLVFQSYRLQNEMRNDLMGKALFGDDTLQNDYESLKKKWIHYPQLSYVGTINDVYLANYAIKAKKYEDALKILNEAATYNKDAFLLKAFKSEIYLNVYDNLDSVKYYSENIFDGYPAFKTNYRILKKVYKKEKDTTNLFRIMDRYTKLNYRDVSEWEAKANTVYDYTKNSKRMLKVLDTGLAYNPFSNKLISAKQEVLRKLKFKDYLSSDEVKKKHQEAYEFFRKQQYPQARKVYEEILKTNKNDYLSIQNIGIIDLVLKNYEAAVENLTIVINAKAFSDGKAEYSRGYSYEQLGQLEKAKADYRRSRAKNYPQAMSLPESKYQ